MKLDIFNIDKFIEVNKCPEVKNPVFFNFDTTPTEDGLFSYELFGYTDDERKNIFGYIDLKGHYIHPLIYKMMTSRMGSIRDIILGKKYAVIANKKIKIVDEDFDGASTGIDFIYDNFEKIDWITEIEEIEEDSLDKKTRLRFLKSIKKEEFFVSKWLVLPPFYRAESTTNKSVGDVVNKLYKELISKTKAMSVGFSYNLFGIETKIRIQNILRDIYSCTTSPVSGKHLIIEKGKQEGELKGTGKNSMVRKHLLGKSIDWTASCVITSPNNSSTQSYDKKVVPYGYCAIPLASTLSLFQPFIVEWISTFLEKFLLDFEYLHIHNIKNFNHGQFNSDKIEKFIKKFIQSPNDRFEPISFEYTDKNNKTHVENLVIYEYDSEEDANNETNRRERVVTLADLMFMAAAEVTEGKHVYVTRYPVANFQNIFPARVKVLSTAKTRHIYVRFPGSDIVFDLEEYPSIPHEGVNISDVHSKFYDVMLCGNAYLDALGGDYDGDMLYLRAVFTQEANAEAEKLIWNKTNMLRADGSLSRGVSNIGKEAILGLFELTKE